MRNENEPITYQCYKLHFQYIMNSLGMKHKPHDSRHTFITKAKKYNLNEYIIKIVVGHKITDITEGVYTHRTQSEILREINKIKK